MTFSAPTGALNWKSVALMGFVALGVWLVGTTRSGLGVSVLLHLPDPAIRVPRAEHSLPQHGHTSGFCRSEPLSSVDTPWWATDRTLLGWENSGLTEGVSHATAPDFPHCCDCKETRIAQARAVNEALGTHRERPGNRDHPLATARQHVAMTSTRLYNVCTCRCTLAVRGSYLMPTQSASDRSQKDTRLNLRASSHQQQMIRQAANAVDKSVTDFVLESATASAERVLADRRWFIVSDEDWSAFEALIDAPVDSAPRLAALLQEPTVLDS